MKNCSFNQKERKQLLSFVRQLITSYLSNQPVPEPPELKRIPELGACFVTLKDAEGNLRGCMGCIEAFEPLGDNLKRCAINAAVNDPRFPEVDLEELQECRIELSILTPEKKISDPEEFTVGEDGIILRYQKHSAVFLPQVATEQGWDRDTTLCYLSDKAGLSPFAWKKPEAQLFTFQAEVFAE